MMDIILHVGAHRSATTTLQRMMGQSGPALNAAGVGYWGPKRTRSGLFSGLIGQDDAVLPWQAGRAEARIRAQIARERRLGRTALFVSEENMLGSMREVLEHGVLYPGTGARLARFARGMDGHRITVALCLRSYEAWWRSALAFRLTRGGPLPSRGYSARLVAQSRRWRDVISDIAMALPDAAIRVWPHESLSAWPDAVAQTLLSRPLDLSGATARLNTGDTLDRMRHYIADIGLHPGLIRAENGRFEPFDQDQRAQLRAHYAEDLAWLAAGAGGKATFLDRPGRKISGPAGPERGRPDDTNHRRLARTCRERASRQIA
jgi:hypothetical protein